MRSILPLAVALAATSALPAQDLGPYQENKELGVKYQMPRKLNRIPAKIGESDPHERDQYKAVESGDFIATRWGAFPWELVVLTFEKNPPKEPTGATTGEDAGKDDTPEEKKAKKKLEEAVRNLRTSKNFSDWIHGGGGQKKERKFLEEGKTKKKAGTIEYGIWHVLDVGVPFNVGPIDVVRFAAVYDLPEREVAIMASLPEAGFKKKELMLRNVFASLRPLDKDEGETVANELDKLADTPERKQNLAAARKNIEGNKSWDIMGTRNYLVLYSFPNPDKKQPNRQFAKALVDKLEKMRDLYMRDFPPPPGTKFPWSVFRVCSTYEEFNQYGGTSGGVVGWFNPGSKELVVFNGKALMGSGSTETVTFHEGWHQYCDSFFGVELQRWFDEGHGDYFGSYIWTGKWDYEANKMRRAPLHQQLREKSYVPIKDIVYWNKDKFYGANAVRYYEQAYGIIDFLRRGPKSTFWKKDWDKILPTYIQVAAETKDAKKAVDAAFAGIDMDAFEEAWASYCRKNL